MLRVTALNKIQSALANLLRQGEPLLVGVSGGPDSVALLDALVRLGYQPQLAHLNHQLRGAASDADAEFVRQLASQHGLPAHIAAVRAAPDEEACREARLNFFGQVAKETGVSTLALAHTADDQVETFLLHLLRGAGTTGLTGIVPDRLLGRLRVIRPLLTVSRADVLQYLTAYGLQYREDASNAELRFSRNRVRHVLLPLLEREFNPQVRAALMRTAEILRDEDACLTELVAKYRSAASLSVQTLRQLPVALQRRVIREWLGVVDFNEVEAVRHLAAAESPSGAVDSLVYREYDALHKTQGQGTEPAEERWPLKIGGETVIVALGVKFVVEGAELSALSLEKKHQSRDKSPHSNEAFDADALGAAPFLRTWQEGDRFQPLGMIGEKKLQDFFVDEKVPRRQRSRVPVLCSSDGRIAWVVGYRIAEPFKVTGSTKRVVWIKAVSV